MIDKEHAKSIASDYLQTQSLKRNDNLVFVLLTDKTKESEFGWVFVYDSEQHIKTNDPRFALAGGGPILIDKQDGSLHEFGSAFPAERCLQKYDELRRDRKVTADEVMRLLRDDHLSGSTTSKRA